METMSCMAPCLKFRTSYSSISTPHECRFVLSELLGSQLGEHI